MDVAATTTQPNDAALPAIAPAARGVPLVADALATSRGERPLPTIERPARVRANPRAKRSAERGEVLVVVLLPAKRADHPGEDVELLDEGEAAGEGSAFNVRELGDRTVLDLEQARELARQNVDARRAFKQFRREHPRARAVALEVCASLQDLRTWIVCGLGDLLAIEYEVQRSSARAGLPFRHRFRRGKQVLALTRRGEHATLRRKGSRLRVTSRGIED